ncbi:MAG: SpoIID/LytB domain-containing protein [Bacteroidales bacterium]|nr:SpoIID/LytB domain-containing protein [Bacteroidales bacterium]
MTIRYPSRPLLRVGIMSGRQMEFSLPGDGAARRQVCWDGGKVSYLGKLYDSLEFDEGSFTLYGVTIGVDFHWQRRRDLSYSGSLEFIVEGDSLTAVNKVDVEEYLLSVISSEMKSSAGAEFLKAHAVISRSWVLSQIRAQKRPQKAAEGMVDTPERYIHWFDHEDHTAFDVCADDHCQRYQGITMAVGENVRRALKETCGEVLAYEGEICDARFSKCCGGTTELFSTCWEDRDYPYLQSVKDPFCDTSDTEILAQVLNDYDLETRDFFRWEQRYSRQELSDLIKERSGIDFGTIEDLVPLERGESGRIKRLLVTGSRRSMEIGKELIIRRWLSTSHLKSSDFEVRWEGDEVVLQGGGWGHGVGLCQIGAAVMAARGYGYKEILAWYYPGSQIEKCYD